MNARAKKGSAGFTLVEVLIAVSLFALIGLAGLTVVQSIIDVQRRTEGRLDRLAERQRAMHVLTADFEQLRPGSLSFDGVTLAMRRATLSGSGSDLAIAYDLTDGVLRRVIGEANGAKRSQALLTGIDVIAWRFYMPASGWMAPQGLSGADTREMAPLAIELSLSISNQAAEPGGVLRRVVALPVPVRP